MTFAVIPGTIFESSSQFRPRRGTSCICVGFTLPATCVEVVSTSGASPVTVTVSATVATFIRIGAVTFWPTSSWIFSMIVPAKPCKIRLHLVHARRELEQTVVTPRVGHDNDLRAFQHLGRRDRDAREHRFRLVGHRADDGRLLGEDWR